MKNILSFNKYHLINEEGETPESTDTGTENKDIKPHVKKQQSQIVMKDFFRELRTHLIYWFENGKIKDRLKAEQQDIKLSPDNLTIFATELEKGNPKYQWRIKFMESEVKGMIETPDDILLSLNVFDYEKQYLIKKYEIVIPIKDINENFLLVTIDKIKRTILKQPKNKEDIKNFKNREKNMLSDDIY